MKDEIQTLKEWSFSVHLEEWQEAGLPWVSWHFFCDRHYDIIKVWAILTPKQKMCVSKFVGISVDRLTDIYERSSKLTPAKFQEIFGDEMGDHLWGKFELYDFSLLTLWAYLDMLNRRRLQDYLAKGE